jgi:membrane-associated phospholipid phosphatase
MRMRAHVLVPLMLLVSVASWADESPPVALHAESCWDHVADCVDAKTHAIPPTQLLSWHFFWSWEFPKRFLERTVWDTAYMLTAPGRWDGHDWQRFTLLTGIAGGSFALDHQVDLESRVRHPRSNTERKVENWLEDFGSFPAIAGMLGGSFVGGLIFDNEEARRLAVDAGEALVISGGIFVSPLKEVIGRSRPNAGNGPWQFHPFSGAASMPSGHSTTAFTLASALSTHFYDTPAAAIPSYGIATVVAFTRVRGSAHFVSDVVIGALIGTVSGRTVVQLERDRRHDAEGRPRETSFRIEPWLGPGVRGVQLVRTW